MRGTFRARLSAAVVAALLASTFANGVLATPVAAGDPLPHAVIRPGPKAAAYHAVAVTLGTGVRVAIEEPQDCTAFSTVFLQTWCADLLAFSIASLPILPSTAQTFTVRPDEAMIYAAFDEAFIRQDPALCDVRYIQVWMELAGHASDGSAACRASVQYLIQRGYMQTLDPGSLESVFIGSPPAWLTSPSAAAQLGTSPGLAHSSMSAPKTTSIGVHPDSVWANCNTLQTGNSFVSAQSYSPGGLTRTYSTISETPYFLCYPNSDPIQDGSGAWSALEGPHPAGSYPTNDIVQIGYWECAISYACDYVAHIPYADYNEVVYFYADGNANDPTRFPSPWFLGVAPIGGSHTFQVSRGSDWTLTIDGGASGVKHLPLNAVNWSPVHGEIGAEDWNCGDQLGGSSVAPETFASNRWVDLNNKVHYMDPPTRRGSPNPSWAFWTGGSGGSNFGVYTSTDTRSC